jgi:hypothetical protein
VTLTKKKFHLALLTTVLTAYACWSISTTVSTGQWGYALGALAAIVAAAGVVKSQRWSALLIYLIALVFAAEWLWYIWLIVRLGFFSHLEPSQVLVSVIPGVAVVGIAGYCCFIAWRYVGRHLTEGAADREE